MSMFHGPTIVTSGLVLLLDGINLRSYSGSGTQWYDLSGLSYNLTLQASPTYNTANGSFSFNGSTQWAQQTSAVATYGVAAGLTVMAFINPTNLSSINSIVSHQSTTASNDGWRMVTRSPGKLAFTLGSVADYTSSTAALSSGAWQHVAVTTLGTTLTYFVNGVQYDSATIGAMSGTPASWQVGRDQGGGAEFMTGSIGNVGVYNRALTPTQVQQNFNAQRGRYGI